MCETQGKYPYRGLVKGLINKDPCPPNETMQWDNVLYVMEQVGHDDQDTTNRIYRHLSRQRQQHGPAFDRVVADAREEFGTPAPGARLCGLKGTGG